MSVSLVSVLIGMALLGLIGHLVVKRRFAALNANLAETYQSAITAPPDHNDQPRLTALSVDLLRKQHCNIPFDDLTPQEKKIVLHARAVDALPTWMSRYAALWLSKPQRVLIGQLQNIKSSRPEQPKQHFGAVKHQLQLRSSSES